MSLIKKLFGGAAAAQEAAPEIYKDYKIIATPIKEDGGYRLSVRIEKEVDGELKRESIIRADTFSAEDEAEEAAINKAKLLIDQMGDQLFT